MHRRLPLALVFLLFPVLALGQANDDAYTKKIREYTTDRMFLTELVDRLPASATVPSPRKVLGYIVGTPGKLTYAKDVYRYFRALAKASPRVTPANTALFEADREPILSVNLHRRTIPRWPTKPRNGMSYQLRSEKQVSSPQYLSLPWFITLVAAFCVLVPVAGTVAQEVGGWPGWAIWLVVWGMMFGVAWFVTYKYANPNLPLICGVMMGLTAPRPSDVWLRQITGEASGTPFQWIHVPQAIDFAITMIWVAVGITIFTAIATRHKSSSAG